METVVVRRTLTWAGRIVSTVTLCVTQQVTTRVCTCMATAAYLRRLHDSINMKQGGLFVMLVFLPAAWGNSAGPPTDSQSELCQTMVPGHGKSSVSEVERPPYAIELSTDKYKKAEPIDVTLYSTEPDKFFRGFFIQARLRDPLGTTAFGSFISKPEDGSQFVQCETFNSAWGHSHRNKKTSVTARWLGPAKDSGVLVFNATVVGYNREQYWTGILSSDVEFGSANGVQSSSLVLVTMAISSYVVRM